MRNIHITRYFFIVASIGVILIACGHLLPLCGTIGKTFLIVLLGLTVLDILLVSISKNPLTAQRILDKRMNLGDPNKVSLSIINQTIQPLSVLIYEGYPVEMQKRSSAETLVLLPRKKKSFDYVFQPTERGKYFFRNVSVYVRSPLFLIQRKITLPLEQEVHVYPSVLQMKQFELKVFNQQTQTQGIKKVRKLGNASEFEQIRNYVQGDDLRTINWKATSRKNELMVNQYQEERSQSVYCIIDKSRAMQLAFHNMTMLDYAINTSLVFSNIALRKGDRPGLITFSNKIGSIVPADKTAGQMKRIIETLFHQKTLFKEGDFQLLYQSIRKTVKTRSLLMLYTNFESEFAMRRALPMLQRINKHHVLVVVFFQNNELQEWSQQPITKYTELVHSTVAEKLTQTKWNIAKELRQHGIQTILTKPEDLSINSINKYLEMKAKGTI